MSSSHAPHSPETEIRITDEPERHRYEARVGDDVAGRLDYHSQPSLITILHTEIDPRFEGRGVGSTLVAGALDDVRARGLSVLIVCPFVLAYVKRHPEYADLLWVPPSS